MQFNVSTVRGLEVAFQSTLGGDVISLAPGVYDKTILTGKHFDETVIIRSANPDNPAVFVDRMVLADVSNVILEDVVFERAAVPAKTEDYGLAVHHASDVIVRNVSIAGKIPETGTIAGEVDTGAKAAGPIIGLGWGTGMDVRDSRNVTFDSMEFSDLQYGAWLLRNQDVTISNSRFHDIRSDGIRFTGMAGLTVEDNLFYDFNPMYNHDNAKYRDHGDFIQWWATYGLGVSGVRIAGNVFLQDNGGDQQAILANYALWSGDDPSIWIEDIEIHDNLFNNSHPHGVYIAGARNVDIHHNTFIPAPQDPSAPQTTNGAPSIDVARDFSTGRYPTDHRVYANVIVEPWANALVPYNFPADRQQELGLSFYDNSTLALSGGPKDWRLAFPDLADRPLSTLDDLVSPNAAAGLTADGHGARGFAPWIEAFLASGGYAPDLPLRGGAGPDALTAPAEGGLLIGGAGDDVLRGGVGDDAIMGGTGSDLMSGGAGADRFTFGAADMAGGDADVITDFSFAEGDALFLHGGFAPGSFDDAVDPGNPLTLYGRGASAIVHAPEDLVELAAHDWITVRGNRQGDTVIEADRNGDLVADWSLTLKGVPLPDGLVSTLSPIGEVGAAFANQTDDGWTRVDFTERLDDPSVILGPLTRNGWNPAFAELGEVDDYGFSFRIAEWTSGDQIHVTETISWMAIEAGTHTVAGRTIAAGSAAAGADPGRVGIDAGFDAAPIVFAQLSASGLAAVSRVSDVGRDGFTVRAQTEEAAPPAVERPVSWVAIEPVDALEDGVHARMSSRAVTDRDVFVAAHPDAGALGDSFAFFAAMQTFNGSDSSTLRVRNTYADGLDVFVEEETSRDAETIHHFAEEFGYALLDIGGLWADVA